MKIRRRRLPIPQHEFGYAPEVFNLIQDTALDGWRLGRERMASEQARRLAEAAQPEMSLASPPATQSSARRRGLPPNIRRKR
jgi:hypothetical protein